MANQVGYGVAFDDAGSVLLTGAIVALTSPYTIDFGGGAFTGDGYVNTFIAKFGSNGSHVWSKRYLAGGGHANGLAIGTDGGNNVLAAGYYDNSINFGGAAMSSRGIRHLPRQAGNLTFLDSKAVLGRPRAGQGNSSFVRDFRRVGAKSPANLLPSRAYRQVVQAFSRISTLSLRMRYNSRSFSDQSI